MLAAIVRKCNIYCQMENVMEKIVSNEHQFQSKNRFSGQIA